MNVTYSCRKAAELITLSQDEPLCTLDSFRLKLHLSMCGNCRNVAQQIEQIGTLLRNPFDAENLPSDRTSR